MEPNFQALRREFPIIERKTYLNSGSYGALANGVKAAVEAARDDVCHSRRNQFAMVLALLSCDPCRRTPANMAVSEFMSGHGP
jgi:hypothetical protein